MFPSFNRPYFITANITFIALHFWRSNFTTCFYLNQGDFVALAGMLLEWI